MATAHRSARAETDLMEIWGHIANDDPAAADRLRNRRLRHGPFIEDYSTDIAQNCAQAADRLRSSLALRFG